ncbi:hypothetical protein VCHA53O466_40326 [Vibrio chagasii]|nr:hypothetical protein VCHA53O466_40326 [Vibrio chagasii]
MIEVFIRKGFQKEAVASHVSLLKRMARYGEVSVFYCDSEYNVVSLRLQLQSFLSELDLSLENFNLDYISTRFQELDEKLLDLDVICRCLVLVWVSPDGRKIVLKGGDFVSVYELFYGWDKYESQAILFFPSRTDNDMFLGSGICLPLVTEVPEGNHVYLISDNTRSFIDSCGDDFDPNKYAVNKYSESGKLQTTQNIFDPNDFNDELSKGRLDLLVSKFESKYFSKKRIVFSQFFAIIK